MVMGDCICSGLKRYHEMEETRPIRCCSRESHVSDGENSKNVREIKVIISSKQLAELLSQSHAEALASFLLEKLRTGGVTGVRVNAKKAAAHSTWRPSLEDIPEVCTEE